MIGKINHGVAVVGTDINRMCDAYTHEGVDIDDKVEGHLYVVRITKATADGTATAGEGIFRIAQSPKFKGGW